MRRRRRRYRSNPIETIDIVGLAGAIVGIGAVLYGALHRPFLAGTPTDEQKKEEASGLTVERVGGGIVALSAGALLLSKEANTLQKAGYVFAGLMGLAFVIDPDWIPDLLGPKKTDQGQLPP
jgi:hypothetical protein